MCLQLSETSLLRKLPSNYPVNCHSIGVDIDWITVIVLSLHLGCAILRRSAFSPKVGKEVMCEFGHRKKQVSTLQIDHVQPYLVPMGWSLRETESPKSEMIACFDDSPVSKTFSGLISLWRIWCPWRWLIPRAIPVAMCLAESMSNLFVALSATSRLYCLHWMHQHKGRLVNEDVRIGCALMYDNMVTLSHPVPCSLIPAIGIIGSCP